MAKLYFRYGAMGSSKSANILMVRYNYEERGQYAVLLKPRTDNRDGEHEIKSRIGLEAPAEYVDEFLKEISETWSADSGEYRYHGKKVDAVLIDEAQFLSPEEVDTLSDIGDFYGIPVLCYGLRADFQTHLFPGSRRLMEIADIIAEDGRSAIRDTQTEKSFGKARRFSLDRTRVMWRFAGNIIKKESCGRKMSKITIYEVQERMPRMETLVELWEASVRATHHFHR